MLAMSEGSRGGKTILVAEDERDIAEVVRMFLEGEGYRVIEAENGERAVEVARRELPDLIMMDLNMPVLDGIGAAKRIREDPRLRDVPILTNSAYGKQGMEYSRQEEELGPGFTFYFTKPLDYERLGEMLRRLLQ